MRPNNAVLLTLVTDKTVHISLVIRVKVGTLLHLLCGNSHTVLWERENIIWISLRISNMLTSDEEFSE